MISLVAACLLAAPPVSADLLTVTDIDGNTYDLHGEVAVFVFVKTTCPIANYYHPTLRRLSDAWGDDAKLIVVHTEVDRDRDELASHQKEYSVAGTIVHDAQSTLARGLGASITPEAIVVDRLGMIRYRGRIDDTYLGFGRRRQVVSSADLSNAVEAVLLGKTVSTPTTKAIGCRIRFREAVASE